MDFDSALHEIATDHVSGATALAVKGLAVLQAALRQDASSREAWLDAVWAVAVRLMAAQPSMAPFINMVNRALLAADEAAGLSEARESALSEVRALAAEWREAVGRVVERALGVIPARATILTHSNSLLVRQSLMRAYAEGRRIRVTCTESRPMREGVALARTLAQAGIKVTLIADAAAHAEVAERAELVVVGADSVSSVGLVNKAGTLGIALTARRFGKPIYALCGADKVVPAGCEHLVVIQDREPKELLAEPIEGVRVRNVQFDVTPVDCLDGLVTERGPLNAQDVLAYVESMPVHERITGASVSPT